MNATATVAPRKPRSDTLRHLSPLRYPGGKAQLGEAVTTLLAAQSVRPRVFIEPFAGGAGLGLRLLADGVVEHLHINDANPGIAAFWRSITSDPDSFIDRIASTEPTMETWRHQRAIYADPSGRSDLDLGFAAFCLNRMSRSGILSANPIGGLSQSGRWLIDARWYPDTTSARVRTIGALSERISVTELDAVTVIENAWRNPDDVFLFVDPPYAGVGDRLYCSTFDVAAHQRLAAALAATTEPWMLTHGDDTRTLYPSDRTVPFAIDHSANVRKQGVEFAVFGPTVILPAARAA